MRSDFKKKKIYLFLRARGYASRGEAEGREGKMPQADSSLSSDLSAGLYLMTHDLS